MSSLIRSDSAMRDQLDVLYYGVINPVDKKYAGGLRQGKASAANKAALQAAFDSMTRPGLVAIPPGYYDVDPGINVGPMVVGIEGAGKYQTTLGCPAGSPGIFMFGLPDGQTTEYFKMRDIGITGSGAIDHALRLPSANHSQVRDCLVTGTKESALYLGGYCIDVDGNDLFSNIGTGLSLGGTLNNISVTRNRIYANDGIGIAILVQDTDAGLSINIEGNALEQNKLAAITSYCTKGLRITGNYFERNCATGYPYADPEAITIRADIHLLASNTISIDTSDTRCNKSAIISGNHVTPLGTGGGTQMDAFVFSSYADNLRIENNQVFDATKINSLVALYRNRAKSKVAGQMIVSGNTVNTVGFIGSLDLNTQAHATAHLIQIADIPVRRNYHDQNFFASQAIAGTTGTWTHATDMFHGRPIWEVGDGDRQWAQSLDLTQYPELIGKWVWFGMWVNTQGSLTNARLFINGQSSSADTDLDNENAWKFKSTLQYIAPGTTTLTCGIKKVGNGLPLRISQPMLTIVGTRFDQVPIEPTTWRRAFYPLDGKWKVGDVVKNSVVSMGQPRQWVCTAEAGSGTWATDGTQGA